MNDQLSFVPGIKPEHLIHDATNEHHPIASLCLFSGGGDSAVLAHRCREHYEALVFIETGTAIPGVREHVERFAAWLDKTLWIYYPERVGEPSGTAWRRLVLEAGGFPGPAGHGRAYTRLKERAIEALVRDQKLSGSRADRVMLLTGKRRAESVRRRKTTKGIERRGGQLYVNPLIDWTNREMQEYRQTHNLPQSDVAALLHRSGECNCGAFAQSGERDMLRDLWPEWFDATIASLEREAQEAGISASRWGEAPPLPFGSTGDLLGPLCSSCEWRQLELTNGPKGARPQRSAHAGAVDGAEEP